MKKFLTGVVIYIVLSSFLYMIFAFIADDICFSNWSTEHRITLALLTAIPLGVSLAVISDNQK